MIYVVPTGVFSTDDGEVLLEGCYAGGYVGAHPEAVNNPAFVDQHNTGPLPPGVYGILPLETHTHLGPAMELVPHPGNQMFGRGGFFIHYNNPTRDAGLPPYPPPAGRNSSDGCIVVTVPGALAGVEQRRAAGDGKLTVAASTAPGRALQT